MEDDWDLHAVVRSCAAAATTTTTTTSSSSSATTSCSVDFQPRQDDSNSFSFQDLRYVNNSVEELHELCKPFFTESPPQRHPVPPPPPPQQSPQRLPILPLSVQNQLNTRPIQPKRLLSVNGSASLATLNTQSPRTKRRKNQLKKVCQVAADALSSDMWSWRKYGQKPIKGSPYPRGYYKCSTSKGCMARKQVERNRSDPNMFIITYTSEHNHPMPTHRNSLAGISRHKTGDSETGPLGDSNKPTSSSPSNSPAPENQESSREEKEDVFEDDDDEFGVSTMALDIMEPDDDFFEGLEELAGPDTGDCLPEKSQGTMQFPWVANSAATTAAGSS